MKDKQWLGKITKMSWVNYDVSEVAVSGVCTTTRHSRGPQATLSCC